MPDISVIPPAIFQEAYFSFKEPVAKYVRNKLNTIDVSIKFSVTSVMSMRELLEVELRDPYKEVYGVLEISDYEYRKDVLNNIPIYTLRNVSMTGVVSYLRVPLNYISEYGSVSDIFYTNRLLVIDLGKLPKDLSLDYIHTDLRDMVQTRVGVSVMIKEVSIGNPDKISMEEYKTREAIRVNSISVRKTTAYLLAEITHKYNEVIRRLTEMGISLG